MSTSETLPGAGSGVEVCKGESPEASDSPVKEEDALVLLAVRIPRSKTTAGDSC